MNVLSLFDGMSCGQIVLQELGIKPESYFAAEIDKHAIKVSSKKFPKMIHLGSVVDVHAKDLPKIDLLIAGSPCQGFSDSGKGLNFNDPRSRLFFEFVRILKEIREVNPDIEFLLENVRMKKEWEDIISRILEIQPICINSALVSAQNRERLYWTNVGMKKHGLFGDNYCSIPQPKDKGIYLIDILEKEVDEKYYLKDRMLERILSLSPKMNPDKAYAVTSDNNTTACQKRSATLIDDEPVCVRMIGRNPDNPTNRTSGNPTIQMLEPKVDGKTGCLTTVAKDNLIIHNMMPRSSKTGKGGSGHLFRTDGKTYCLDTGQTNEIEFQEPKRRIRRLTPKECCRLQTVPDNYFFENTCGGGQICSDSQIYKMCGNGWTVDVICHILSFAKFNSKP